jgi:hypothetical protein
MRRREEEEAGEASQHGDALSGAITEQCKTQGGCQILSPNVVCHCCHTRTNGPRGPIQTLRRRERARSSSLTTLVFTRSSYWTADHGLAWTAGLVRGSGWG